MARILKYDAPQVAPQVGDAGGYRAPSTDGFGIPGQQMQQFGQTLEGSGHVAAAMITDTLNRENRLRAMEAGNKLQQFALEQQYGDDGYTKLKGDASKLPSGKPLGVEYGDRVRDMARELSGGLANDAQREAYNEHAANVLMQFDEGAMRYEAAQAHGHSISVTEATVGTAKDSIGLNPYDQLAIRKGLVDIDDATRARGSLENWSQEEIDLRSHIDRSSAVKLAGETMLARGDTAGARALGERYNSHLTADGANDLLTKIKTEELRQAAAERADAAHMKALATESIATDKAKLESGAGTPSDWATLAQRQHAIGDTSGSEQSMIKGAQMQATLEHRGDSLSEMDAKIAALEAKRTTPTGMDVAEASTLNGLKDLRAQSASRLTESGGALKQLSFATGRPINPLNMADPSTFHQRAQEATAAAVRYGRAAVEPLQPHEVQPLKDMVAGTPEAQLQALKIIGQFGDARAIEGAARQITGADNGAFRIAATLVNLPNGAGEVVARDVLRGQDALKTIGKWFQPNDMRERLGTYAASALRDIGPDYAKDVLQAATAIYATRVNRAGITQFEDHDARAAIDAALGAYRMPNGEKRGGLADFGNGEMVKLPTGWTAQGMFERMARGDDQHWQKATVSGPAVWPDGSKPTLAEIKKLTPVWLGGTRYGLRTRAGALLPSSSGGAYLVDMNRFSWK